MNTFTRRYTLAFLTFCVFSFKIILIEFGESGLRTDDFLAVGMFLLVISVYRRVNFVIPRSLLIYLGFLTVSLFSLVINSIYHRVDPVLCAVFIGRLGQYLIFYFVGYMLVKYDSFNPKIFSYYAVFLMIVVPLQNLEILPVISGFSSSRAIGNTNGPYELAAVCSFLIFWLSSIGNQKLYVGMWVIEVMTGSRITIFSTAAIDLIKRVVTQRIEKGIALILFFIAVSLLAVVFIAVENSDSEIDYESTTGRLSSIFEVSGTLQNFENLYDVVPIYQNDKEYFFGTFIESVMMAQKLGGDDSLNIRMVRWATLIKSAMQNNETILFGLGPSFGSAAVDGHFVRVFVETGLFGEIVFIIFILSVLKDFWFKSKYFCFYFLTLLFTGIFIDIFTSYKPMMFMWLWMGMIIGRKSEIK